MNTQNTEHYIMFLVLSQPYSMYGRLADDMEQEPLKAEAASTELSTVGCKRLFGTYPVSVACA